MRKRVAVRRAAFKATQAAKADARARRVLDMVDRGLTHEEIAAALGVRVTSVRGAVQAARRRLT